MKRGRGERAGEFKIQIEERVKAACHAFTAEFTFPVRGRLKTVKCV